MLAKRNAALLSGTSPTKPVLELQVRRGRVHRFTLKEIRTAQSVRLKCRLWRWFHVYLFGLPLCLVTKLPASLESFSDVNCGEDGDCDGEVSSLLYRSIYQSLVLVLCHMVITWHQPGPDRLLLVTMETDLYIVGKHRNRSSGCRLPWRQSLRKFAATATDLEVVGNHCSSG